MSEPKEVFHGDCRNCGVFRVVYEREASIVHENYDFRGTAQVRPKRVLLCRECAHKFDRDLAMAQQEQAAKS